MSILQTKVKLISGPKTSTRPSETHNPPSKISSSKEDDKIQPPRRPLQQPKILEPRAALILGHHKVPPVATLNQLHITHIPDKLMDIYVRHYHSMHASSAREARKAQIENASVKESERQRQKEMFEMMKIQQRLLYTFIATIGIPVVLLVVFYIEVSFYVYSNCSSIYVPM